MIVTCWFNNLEMNEMKMSFGVRGVFVCLALSMPLVSNAELSANIGVVSLYKDRGVDQEGRDEAVRPAIQGGLDYSFDSGFYIGNWNSTGRFEHADVEMDLYGGYRFEFAHDWKFDVGYIHYVYPGEGAWNSGEVYAGVGYQRFLFKTYRGVRDNVNQGDMYYRLTYTQPIMDRLDALVGVGYQHFDNADLHGKFDYSMGLSYALTKHVSVSGTVAGANRRHDVEDHSRDTRFIVGVTAAY